MVHKLLLLALACFALLAPSSAQQSCDGFFCDPCPTYRDSDGVVEVEQTKECVVNNGKAELKCACADPPADALPAGRDAPAGNGGSEAGEGLGVDFNDLPPDGGSGAVIPTQSFGAPPSAAAKPLTSLLFLATVAAVAAATMA